MEGPKRRDTWVIAQMFVAAIRSVSTLFECGFGGEDEGQSEVCNMHDYNRFLYYVADKVGPSQAKNIVEVAKSVLDRCGETDDAKYKETMLTISTAHMTGPYPDYGPFRAIHHQHGTIVFMMEAKLEDMPLWLKPIYQYCSKNGVNCINFDADAPVYTHRFKIYSWEDSDESAETVETQ